MQPIRLFVYGSLKRGCRNHHRMGGAIFMGAAATSRGYVLYAVGNYPALVATGDGMVTGELYEVSDEHLRELDAFEGHPELYRRSVIVLADGARAMAYTMSKEHGAPSAVLLGSSWLEPAASAGRARQR